MNKITFLDIIKKSLNHASKDSLADYIYELAKKQSEEERNTFLNEIVDIANGKEIDKINIYENLERDYAYIDKALSTIENQERGIDTVAQLRELYEKDSCSISYYGEKFPSFSEINEDVYTDDDISIDDDNGIINDIKLAFDVVHQCIDLDRKKEGYELVKRLVLLNIETSGAYYELHNANLTLSLLQQFSDIGLKKQFVYEAMYLAYTCNDEKIKMEAVYYIVENLHAFDFEPKEINHFFYNNGSVFVDEWLDYLLHSKIRNRRERTTSIINALQFYENQIKRQNILQSCVTTYPEVILYALNAKIITDEAKLYALGNEAYENIGWNKFLKNDFEKALSKYKK